MAPGRSTVLQEMASHAGDVGHTNWTASVTKQQQQQQKKIECCRGGLIIGVDLEGVTRGS